MDMKECSTGGLHAMHKGVSDAFDIDERTPPGEAKPYGVREYADWRRWADQLEAELKERGEAFEKIRW